MNEFKLALAGLAAVGGALVAAPEPAQAGGFGFSVGFGHPGYYGHGYYPASYGWGHPVYYRPRRVVYGYPYHYRRPFVRRVVYHRPYYYARPHRVRYISRAHYGRPFGHYRGAWW